MSDSSVFAAKARSGPWERPQTGPGKEKGFRGNPEAKELVCDLIENIRFGKPNKNMGKWLNIGVYGGVILQQERK